MNRLHQRDLDLCTQFNRINPEPAAPLAGFTAMVARSRPVPGLHYPSDALAGAAIGTLVAVASLRLPLFA
jgi:membrane-associated phospholipid phosphatase